MPFIFCIYFDDNSAPFSIKVLAEAVVETSKLLVSIKFEL